MSAMIKIKNWEDMIHYKSKNPKRLKWIKYPCNLIDMLEFRTATVEARAMYPLVLSMAAKGKHATPGVIAIDDIVKYTKSSMEDVLKQLNELYECGLVVNHKEELPNNGMPEGWGVPKVPTPEEKAEMDRLTKEAFGRMFASMEESRHYGKKK